MRVGRLHVQVLKEFDPGELPRPCSLYLVVSRLVFGFIIGDADSNPFVDIYLGWWLVEFIWDNDGSWDDE